MGGTAWTDEDTKTLKRLWGKITASGIAEEIGRTTASVQIMASRIGLPAINSYASEAQLRKSASRAERDNRPWSQDEIELLRELWPDERVGVIALRLGRTCRTVAVAAYNMGLTRKGAYKRDRQQQPTENVKQWGNNRYRSFYGNENLSTKLAPPAPKFKGDINVGDLQQMSTEKFARAIKRITSGRINCYGL